MRIPQPSNTSISIGERLVDVERALQSSVSAITTQMREIIAARHLSDGPGTALASTVPLYSLAARTDTDTPAAMSASVQPRGNSTFTTTTAMTSIERATEKSLRSEPAFAHSYSWPYTTSGIPSKNLPDVETVSPALRSAIVDGHHMPVYPAQPGQMVGTCPMETERKQQTTPLDQHSD